MATYGKIKPFQPSVDDWTIYQDKLKFYFSANGIVDDTKKRAILLTVCGDPAYKLLRSMVPNGELDADGITYTSLVTLLKDHYAPKTSVIVHRYNFNTRSRNQGESIADYVAVLRNLALDCKFGPTERLEEMLRDRLVCGVNHTGIQRKLLSESDLTYSTALKLAQAAEASEQDAKKLTGGSPQQPFQDNNPDLHYTTSSRRPEGTPVSCYRCGGPHLAPKCKYKEIICNFCRKKGHFARVCRSRKLQTQPSQSQENKDSKYSRTNHIEAESPSAEAEYDLYNLHDNHTEPYHIMVTLNDLPVQMELDTGAAVSVISEATYNSIQRESQALEPSNSRLRTYTGESIQVLGTTRIKARYDKKELSLSIHVVPGSGPNLLGRDWISQLEVDLKSIHMVTSLTPLQTLLDTYSAVFTDELGCLKGVNVQLVVHDQAKPRFHRPRPLPFLLKPKVEEELNQLQEKGIISPVQFSSWAAPVVPVLKRNGKIRLCGDYKLTINQVSPTETYPLPRAEELFANLSAGKIFSKLDLSNAYLQFPLDEQSKQYVTINTHKGLFQYNRLPYGVASAPAIFQRHMEMLLQGANGVSVYLDDILVAGTTMEDHLHNLKEVLKRLDDAGLRLNKEKCFFLRPSIEYLGHVIDKDGLRPTGSKVRAIKEAPHPKNVTQLRSFLGLINYYGKFLPNLSARLNPLYSLLNKDQKWQWNCEQEEAFQSAKEALQADSLLTHYDTTKPLLLACDASDYGIGAVLSHIGDDSQERPVAYASRTLSSAEKHYSQLEKEALAIVFAVKKFHHYLWGRHFMIESDHQPLKSLLGENNRVPYMASSRIQRWAVTLSAYRYTIRHKAGKHLCNADALSRLPRPVTTSSDCVPQDLVLVINHLSSTTVSAANIKQWTAEDPVMSCVLRFLMSGWPDELLDKEYRPYSSRRSELSVLDGCLLRGSRIIIPPPGRQLVLDELHETHPGTSKMKALARSYLWWPGMDTAIEQMVKTCHVCQESRPAPAAAPLHPWEWPQQPWSRLHLDFAGPFLGHMFLVLVDAHSKWLDVHLMNSITSSKTIETLRSVFATHGLPHKVVTDNGPSFTSEEFNTFLSKNGITHTTTAPYHPSSNGLAERAVQTFKSGLKHTPGASIQERLSKFLFKYRITPHTTTGIPPAELLMNRRPRSRLDRLFPDISHRVEWQQAKQAEHHDNHKPLRSYHAGDTVYVKDFSTTKNTWLPGKITKITGPLSYHVELDSGRTVRRHIDAVRSRNIAPVPPSEPTTENDIYLPDLPPATVTTAPPIDPDNSAVPASPLHQPHTQQACSVNSRATPTRQSSRHCRPPERFGW